MADEVLGSGEFRTTKNPLVGVITLNSGVSRQYRYSQIDGLGVVEGDIVVRRSLETLGIVVVRPGARWPTRTLVYDIEDSLPDQNRVTVATSHWTSRTVMKFKKRTNEPDYVLFRPGGGCSSAVGRMGGVQWITLGPDCSAGNAIHEIGHAVGLWHEQSREDRDRYVTIVWANIDPFYQHNFDQHMVDGDDVGAYDYESIMHYPGNAFAIDPTKPTVVTPNGEAIGQREHLSSGDIAAVAAMYA